MIEYRLIKNTIKIENKEIQLYGIEAVKQITKIENITTDKKIIENLITKCNEGKLATVHLRDVVEDEFE